MNKKQLYTGIGALGVATVIGMGVTTNAGFLNSQAATDALRSGDLEAFKAAVEVEGNERLQNKLDSIDEERFEELQERFNTKEAIQAAIEADDFEAYQEAIADLDDEDGGRRGFRGKGFIAETEEEFNELVSRYNEREAIRADLTAAVENDDRATFDAIIEEQIENKNDDIDEQEGSQLRRGRLDITEEQLDIMWENAQEAVADGEEINLKTLIGRKGFGKGGRITNRSF